jgi:hypothetical protein
MFGPGLNAVVLLEFDVFDVAPWPLAADQIDLVEASV